MAGFHPVVAVTLTIRPEYWWRPRLTGICFVGSLVAGGYEVYAVNPMLVARCRERMSPREANVPTPGDVAVSAERRKVRVPGNTARPERVHRKRRGTSPGTSTGGHEAG
jgi:hypothetical protein